MNGHERRKLRIMQHIQNTALEMFKHSGADKVSMDDIAAEANVSKVTIYKYFHSKEELQRAVVDLFVEDTLAAIEKLLSSDMDFLEKMRYAIGAKVAASPVADGESLYRLLENDARGQNILNLRIRDAIRRFFEEGQAGGYIKEGLSFDTFYQYVEIVQAGFRVKMTSDPTIYTDQKTFAQLIDLYFYGIIRGKREGR